MEIVDTTKPAQFRLSESFLEPYRKKGDPFTSLLARSTYLTKYCRGNTETWTDTIRRVVEGNVSLANGVSAQEAELLFHYFWTGQALPPGRGLWTGGVEGIPADARYNCFSPETRFWANGRLVSFAETVGQTVEVLCADGQWRPAEVKSFGKQALRTIRLAAPGRSLFAHEFVATPGHRWITSNRGVVNDLRVGDRVLVTPSQVNKASQAYVDGFSHGFVFGGGTKETLKRDTFKARLCGEKDHAFEQMLRSSVFFTTACSPPSYKGDPVLFFKSNANLKALPADDSSIEYQAGFLAGWLAADGSVRADGRGGNRLASINGEALNWAVERAPLLGFCVTGRSVDPSSITNFGPRSGPLGVLTLVEEPVEYTVRSITDEGREEEVFCVTEPETQTFTLEGGVPTKNCWYTTLYDTDDWCWTANQLMLGGGVGVGLSGISFMPAVSAHPARFAIWCRGDHANLSEVTPEGPSFLNGSTPVYRVADSREGWVTALRVTLNAAFEGKDCVIDVSDVRPRGEPIRTFGGIACGPGPLSNLLRASWNIIRGASGRKLNSVEALDITNHIGLCIKSGNVRRSALITLGDPLDQGFRDAKKDFEAVKSHRHTSNNSLAFQSWDEIHNFDWVSLVEDNATFGEPGILNLPLVWKTDPGARGVNPCLTADTRVATQFGLVPIGELARTQKPLKVTTDLRVEEGYRVGDTSGVALRDAVPAFMTSPAEEVYRVTTSRGYTIKATKYHKFPTTEGFVELQNLAVGDTLLLQSDEGQWGSQGSEGIGKVIGLIEGDGNFNGSDRVTLRFWGDQKSLGEKMLPVCQDLVSTIPSKNGRAYSLSLVQVENRDYCEITSMRLRQALAEVGYRTKGSVPEVVWRGTRDCVRGYLLGLFAADGQVNWSRGKQSFSVRLSQSSPGLLREVQHLLANFGIVSSVYKRRDAGVKRMPDGHGGLKDYAFDTQYDLIVSKQNAVRFADKVGFLLEAHAATYAEWRSESVRGPYKESFLDEIVEISFVGVEPVFCTTQPTHHTFIADGIVTGNCGEQALHDREACNLAEVFPGQFHPGTDPEVVFRLATRYCLRQRLTPLSDPKSHEVGMKNMRVGVGLGGLCDFAWTPAQLSAWYQACREEADSYADDLGVARPITVTTVKPSGTISLLNGSSPGLHAPHAPFYIRRTRIAKNDPMAMAMIEAGVPFDDCIYDKTGHTYVFSFPTKAAHTRMTSKTETITDQFERQAQVQEWWADNAVSATLNFAEEEKGQLASLLKEYVPRLKSTSCLPKAHGYEQAPYEEISEEVYNRMMSNIDHQHQLVNGGEIEVDECAGGVCPVR